MSQFIHAPPVTLTKLFTHFDHSGTLWGSKRLLFTKRLLNWILISFRRWEPFFAHRMSLRPKLTFQFIQPRDTLSLPTEHVINFHFVLLTVFNWNISFRMKISFHSDCVIKCFGSRLRRWMEAWAKKLIAIEAYWTAFLY